ncbi:hypothetical protein UlMin_039333 [Ulmus minor]
MLNYKKKRIVILASISQTLSLEWTTPPMIWESMGDALYFGDSIGESSPLLLPVQIQLMGDGKKSNPSAEILESGAGSLKNLIEIYKQVILDGDKKSVSDIEARIEVIDIKSGKEKCILLQADFDNFRKRTEDRFTTRSNAQGEVIESFSAMVDNFESAKQQLKLEIEKEKKIDGSYQVSFRLLAIVKYFHSINKFHHGLIFIYA